MFYTAARTAKLQWKSKKDYVFLAGAGLFYFQSDHLFIRRCENGLRTVGIVHEGNTMKQFNGNARDFANRAWNWALTLNLFNNINTFWC